MLVRKGGTSTREKSLSLVHFDLAFLISEDPKWLTKHRTEFKNWINYYNPHPHEPKVHKMSWAGVHQVSSCRSRGWAKSQRPSTFKALPICSFQSHRWRQGEERHNLDLTSCQPSPYKSQLLLKVLLATPRINFFWGGELREGRLWGGEGPEHSIMQ